jgi:hypothetical protein
LLEGGLAKLNATEDALCNLQEPFLTKMDALIKQMFAIPAHTAEGRRAKATILLGCVLGDALCNLQEPFLTKMDALIKPMTARQGRGNGIPERLARKPADRIRWRRTCCTAA